MAISNGYVTLKELQGHLNGDGMPPVYTPQDTHNMEIAIEAISRLIDEKCDTTFYARTETRYFTPQNTDLLWLNTDLISITTLKSDTALDGTYATTWATTDYGLEPRNARVKTNEADKKPYRQIRINRNGNYSFLKEHDSIEIAGSWGYTDGIDGTEPTQVPPFVKNAVLLMANRTYRRKDAIFGIAGTPALGVMTVRARIKEDTDIMNLLSGIDKWGFYA